LINILSKSKDLGGGILAFEDQSLLNLEGVKFLSKNAIYDSENQRFSQKNESKLKIKSLKKEDEPKKVRPAEGEEPKPITPRPTEVFE